MLNTQEMLFVVDENNNSIESKPRDYVHQHKLWHRTTNIYIVNDKKQILCQKRSMLKDTNPGLWETCAGGHVLEGQDTRTSAMQELYEEVGLQVKPEALTFITTYQSYTYHDFQDNFALQWTGDIKSLQLEADEVTEAKWMELQELKRILNSEENKHWSLVGNQQDVLDWIDKHY